MLDGQVSAIGWTVTAVLLTLLARFLYRLYIIRSLFKDLPGPPHHPIWGHLHLMPGIVATIPRLAAPQSLPFALKQKYNLGDLFFLDNWPLGPPMLVAGHPDISDQFIVKSSLPKHQVVRDFMVPIGGRRNLVGDDGQQWKTWRSAFNPGFSTSHLMTLVPAIVDQVDIFRDILAQRAQTNQLFRMEHHATRLTIDIIGMAILDTNFRSQTSENELVSAFEKQVRWLPIGAASHPEELIDFRRAPVLWWNARRMDRYIERELEHRFATKMGRGKTKHVVDLALETYLKEKGTSIEEAKTLDPEFKKVAINQVKTFIFAGHDTSSSAICYCYYHLSKTPQSLAMIRKECDEVLGKDREAVSRKIKQDPHLINKLDYTAAVIREVLRLHPPASSVRAGSKDFFVTDPKTNERYPTEHLMLWAWNVGIHRSEDIWGDPNVFRPERWLTKAPTPEGGNKDAYIAFSKGPRNCIGQELALIEIKTILAMTIRSFDFKAAFDELDKLRGDKSGYPSDSTGVQTQFGDEAYQVQVGTAKPREGMPCRISLAA